MGLNPDFQSIEPEKWKIARQNITKRIDAMTAEQQKAELKRLDDEAVKALQDRIVRAKSASAADGTGDADGDEETSGSGGTLGFVVLLLLVFAIKPLIFGFLSMAAAYRTAAGSVSG